MIELYHQKKRKKKNEFIQIQPKKIEYGQHDNIGFFFIMVNTSIKDFTGLFVVWQKPTTICSFLNAVQNNKDVP